MPPVTYPGKGLTVTGFPGPTTASTGFSRTSACASSGTKSPPLRCASSRSAKVGSAASRAPGVLPGAKAIESPGTEAGGPDAYAARTAAILAAASGALASSSGTQISDGAKLTVPPSASVPTAPNGKSNAVLGADPAGLGTGDQRLPTGRRGVERAQDVRGAMCQQSDARPAAASLGPDRDRPHRRTSGRPDGR